MKIILVSLFLCISSVVYAVEPEQSFKGAVAVKPDAKQKVAAKDIVKADSMIELVKIPAGCFMMGSAPLVHGEDDELPVHKVCLSTFSIGKYEITQGQWRKIMGNNPSNSVGCGVDCPVEQVSWNDTQNFIAKLNAISGKSYRLPTEAEWEYAARSGGKDEKWAGTGDVKELDSLAWFGQNSDGHIHPVGKKKPNSFGLYDMSGNVYEWCSDWYNDQYYATSSASQGVPQGPASGTMRVFRGGSWLNNSDFSRSTYRHSINPGFKNDDIGFRLVHP